MKKLIDKKGMTLVEVIVSMVLVALFMLSAVSVMYPFMRTYHRISTISRQQTLANILMSDIRSHFNDVVYPKTYDRDNDGTAETIVFCNMDLDKHTSLPYIITDERIDSQSGYQDKGYISVRYLHDGDVELYEDNGDKYYAKDSGGAVIKQTIIPEDWLEVNDPASGRKEFGLGRKTYMGNTVRTSFEINEADKYIKVTLDISNGQENDINTRRTEYIDLQ